MAIPQVVLFVMAYIHICHEYDLKANLIIFLQPYIVDSQWLIACLIVSLPHLDTTRLPREGEKSGVEYHFVLRSDMEQDILNHNFLEYGDFANNLYGTTFDSIRAVKQKGQMCVLDVNPQVRGHSYSRITHLLTVFKAPLH